MIITLDIDASRLVGAFKELETGQARYAVARTLTATVQDAQKAENLEIKDSLDSPTPLTLNSTYIKSATKDRLQAEVGIKNFAGKGTPAAKYLEAQIQGGKRQTKRFERALQAAGVMPQGYRAVPGEAAQLDQYGNMSASFIVQLLAYFKAFPEMGYKANMTDKRKAALAKGNKKGKVGVAYFSARDGWLHPGIWARYSLGHGSAIKPVIMFVKDADYEVRFDFFYTAENAIKRTFDGHLKRYWDEAWSTAVRKSR